MGVHTCSYSFSVLARPVQADLFRGLPTPQPIVARMPDLGTRYTEFSARSQQVDPRGLKAFVQRHKLFEQHIPLLSTFADGASALAIERMNRAPAITGLLSDSSIDSLKRFGLAAKPCGSRWYIVGKHEEIRQFTIMATFNAVPALIPPEDTLPIFRKSSISFDQVTRGGMRLLVEAAAMEIGKSPEELVLQDFYRDLAVFGGKNLKGLVEYYRHLSKGGSIEQLKSRMRVDLCTSFERFLEKFIKTTRVERGFWENVYPAYKKRLVEIAANEAGKPSGTLNIVDLTKPLKTLGNKNLRGLVESYMTHCPGKPYLHALSRMRKALGIMPVKFYTFEEALILFKKGVHTYFWKMVSLSDQKKFLELAAEEIGKPVGALNVSDLGKRLKVFAGKSLYGLLGHYLRPGDPCDRALKRMFKSLGINQVEFYSFEEALSLFKRKRQEDFWAMVRPEDQRKFLELAAKELGKPVGALNAADLSKKLFKVFDGKSLYSLREYYRSLHPGTSYSGAIAFMMRTLGIKPVEFYTFEEALGLFKTGEYKHLWEKIRPEDQLRFLEIAANEFGKNLIDLNTKDFNRPIIEFAGKCLSVLPYQYRLPGETSFLPALERMKKALGILPVGNGAF